MIAFGSAFRNSGRTVCRYLERVARFRDEVEGAVRVVAVEGDSTDNTRDALTQGARYLGLDLDLRTHNHGGPVFGSTEAPERMKALSGVGNTIFEGVRETDDCLVYIESDLLWEPEAIKTLVDDVYHNTSDVVFAPLVMAYQAFYDIWGFRGLDGVRWNPHPPYHPDADNLLRFVEVSSVGSCLAMHGSMARRARIRNDYCLVGWCEDARTNHGAKIFVDKHVEVRQV